MDKGSSFGDLTNNFDSCLPSHLSHILFHTLAFPHGAFIAYPYHKSRKSKSYRAN